MSCEILFRIRDNLNNNWKKMDRVYVYAEYAHRGMRV